MLTDLNLPGYPTEWFVNNPEHFTCQICFDVWRNPVQCNRGHICCRFCFNQVLHAKSECPSCKDPISLLTLSANLFARNAVDVLVVRCNTETLPVDHSPQDFCQWTGPLHKRDAHIASCFYRMPIECPLITKGCVNCEFIYNTRRDLRIHLQQYADDKTNEIDRLNKVIASLQEFGHTIVRSEAQEALSLPTTVFCGSVDAQGLKHGLGITSDVDTPNSYYYIGTYNNDLRHGHGVAFDAEGTYNGMWVNGLKHGHCFLHTFPCGSTYTGAFHEGTLHGKGLFKQVDGVIYEGEFSNNIFEGQGVLHSDGDVYTGSFVMGEKHGHGKIVFKDKSVYIGNFENGRCHGSGVLTGPTGLIMNSVFNDGRIVSALHATRVVVDLCNL